MALRNTKAFGPAQFARPVELGPDPVPDYYESLDQAVAHLSSR